MKRRAFLQTGLAAVAVPALPLPAATLASAAPAVPANAAQFWASYFAKLPGHSPVRGVQIAMNMSAAQARRVVSGFVAQGVLSPSALAVPKSRKPLIDLTKNTQVPAELRHLRRAITCTCNPAPGGEDDGAEPGPPMGQGDTAGDQP